MADPSPRLRWPWATRAPVPSSAAFGRRSASRRRVTWLAATSSPAERVPGRCRRPHLPFFTLFRQNRRSSEMPAVYDGVRVGQAGLAVRPRCFRVYSCLFRRSRFFPGLAAAASSRAPCPPRMPAFVRLSACLPFRPSCARSSRRRAAPAARRRAGRQVVALWLRRRRAGRDAAAAGQVDRFPRRGAAAPPAGPGPGAGAGNPGCVPSGSQISNSRQGVGRFS